jgi:hypothetical protein
VLVISFEPTPSWALRSRSSSANVAIAIAGPLTPALSRWEREKSVWLRRGAALTLTPALSRWEREKSVWRLRTQFQRPLTPALSRWEREKSICRFLSYLRTCSSLADARLELDLLEDFMRSKLQSAQSKKKRRAEPRPGF